MLAQRERSDEKILYFAYGSNMLEERLKARCKTARRIGTARADEVSISFGKKSIDGSGKATIERTAESESVWGVLFENDVSEIDTLDRFEGAGKGYDRIVDFTVRTEPDGAVLEAATYSASSEAIDSSLSPYDWYLGLAGARQSGLPDAYVSKLEATGSISDLIKRGQPDEMHCACWGLKPESR